ncbi:hypothetical protein P8610_05815 [Fictibacillus sp. UD]|uniref:hypothetical protein n=1 Tax=Fictibacillus sp. UD TaxID=3038777 RepID=UPI003746FDA6
MILIDRQLIISIAILVVLFESLFITLFIMYRKGRIDRNPFIMLFQKEWNILFHAFFRWRLKSRVSTQELVYPYHKNTSYFYLFLALIHEQIIEMIVFHIYLKKEEPEIALIMLLLHIYSVIYMLGDYNLLRNTPFRIIKEQVVMRIGARRSLQFDVNEINYIQTASIKYNKSGGIINEKKVFHATAFPRILTIIFGISDELKYEIVFKKPIHARGYFGQKQEINKALIYMDKAGEFVGELQNRMEITVNTTKSV